MLPESWSENVEGQLAVVGVGAFCGKLPQLPEAKKKIGEGLVCCEGCGGCEPFASMLGLP